MKERLNPVNPSPALPTKDSSWREFRLRFSNNAVKRPGYIQGPWFLCADIYFQQQLQSITTTDGSNAVKSSDIAARKGRISLPGRIEGPTWFSKAPECISTSSPPFIVDTNDHAENEMPSKSLVPETSGQSLERSPASAKLTSTSIHSHQAEGCRSPQQQHRHASHQLISPSSNIFTKMSTSFSDIELDQRGFIPTQQFLSACREILTILQLMGGRLFAPVKADLSGNISKLQAHYDLDPAKRLTLQDIVLAETAANPGKVPSGSATEALLWLKRSLAFVDEFLMELLKSDDETKECAHRAYKASLESFHNFAIRGLFQAGIYGLPKRLEFIATLADNKERVKDAVYVKQLMSSTEEYSQALRKIVKNLHKFYRDQKLESS